MWSVADIICNTFGIRPANLMQRSGFGLLIFLPERTFAVPSSLNTLRSGPGRGCRSPEPDGYSRRPVGVVATSSGPVFRSLGSRWRWMWVQAPPMRLAVAVAQHRPYLSSSPAAVLIENACIPPFGMRPSRSCCSEYRTPKFRRVVHCPVLRFRVTVLGSSHHRGFRGRWVPRTLGQHPRGSVYWCGQRGSGHWLYCCGVVLRTWCLGEWSWFAGRIRRRHRHLGRDDSGDPRLATPIATNT